MPFIGGGRSHTNKARERRKQQIPIPKSVTTGWNEKREFVGPTYFFTDGNSEKINYIDCLNNLEEINNDEAITNKKSSLVGQKKLAPKDDLGWLLLLLLWIANLICPCFLKESVRTYRVLK